MRDRQSSITNVILNKTHHDNKTKKGEPITPDLSFKIDGNIREVFNPKMWETAYDKHDNVFRMRISVALKAKRRKIFLTKIIRKAPMFWTRSPKIPFRIWVSIIRDDIPFYPVIGNHEVEAFGIVRLPKWESERKVREFKKEFHLARSAEVKLASGQRFLENRQTRIGIEIADNRQLTRLRTEVITIKLRDLIVSDVTQTVD